MHVRSMIVPAMLASAALSAAASAQSIFLIDPAGGTSLFGAYTDDSTAGGRSLGFTGHFFGEEKTTVDVCTNGHMNFQGDSSFIEQYFPRADGVGRIAPLWDDLFVYEGNSVTEKAVAGQYYSVTWQVGTYSYGHVFHQFQVVWFGAAMNIAGNRFQADDIVFCWGDVGANTPTQYCTIGLNKGDGVQWASFPGEPDAVFADWEYQNIPEYPQTGQLLIFRPDGNGGYRRILTTGTRECSVDFNNDGFVDFFDYDDFVRAFEGGC